MVDSTEAATPEQPEQAPRPSRVYHPKRQIIELSRRSPIVEKSDQLVRVCAHREQMEDELARVRFGARAHADQT
jgi:hypothetical protein